MLTKEVDIFNEKAVICERSTTDHISLDLQSQEGKISMMMVYIVTVYDALKLNKTFLKREKYSISKLMKLPPNDIFRLAKEVIELEGGDSTYVKFLLKEITKEEYEDWVNQKKKEIAE